MPRNAELCIRGSEDRRQETTEITTWKLTHGMCLGDTWGRARSRLTSVALTSIASDSRRRRTHPSRPCVEAVIRAVYPNWAYTGDIKCHNARSVDEHAGVRRATCDEDACAKLGGAAGRRHSQRRRAPCSKLRGYLTPCRAAPCRRRGRPKQQRRRRRERPREAHAAAHLRIVPVDAPSKADKPPELHLVAFLCGFVHGLAHRVAHRVLGTGAAHFFCAVVASSAGGARESAAIGAKVRLPRPQRCEA